MCLSSLYNAPVLCVYKKWNFFTLYNILQATSFLQAYLVSVVFFSKTALYIHDKWEENPVETPIFFAWDIWSLVSPLHPSNSVVSLCGFKEASSGATNFRSPITLLLQLWLCCRAPVLVRIWLFTFILLHTVSTWRRKYVKLCFPPASHFSRVKDLPPLNGFSALNERKIIQQVAQECVLLCSRPVYALSLVKHSGSCGQMVTRKFSWGGWKWAEKILQVSATGSFLSSKGNYGMIVGGKSCSTRSHYREWSRTKFCISSSHFQPFKGLFAFVIWSCSITPWFSREGRGMGVF